MLDSNILEAGFVNGRCTMKLDPPVKPLDKEGNVVEALALNEITMREPKGKDQAEIGNPIIFDAISDPPTLRIDDARMMKMICRLANITPAQVGEMSTRQLTQIGWTLAPFFSPV